MSSIQPEIKRVTTQKLREMKERGEKISMLTAYDFSMAKILWTGFGNVCRLAV